MTSMDRPEAAMENSNNDVEAAENKGKPTTRSRSSVLVLGIFVILMVVGVLVATIPRSSDSDPTSLEEPNNAADGNKGTVPTGVPSDPPSGPPSEPVPTTVPSYSPSNKPTESFLPTQMPSPQPTISFAPTLSAKPTHSPSIRQSAVPTVSHNPTLRPSASLKPTSSPSGHPSDSPSNLASDQPSIQPSVPPTAVIYPKSGFYLTGDVPYAPWEERVLSDQIAALRVYHQDHLMFLTHVGDMQQPVRTDCEESRYQTIRAYLQNSPVPTFVHAGDNDYVDCPNPNLAFRRYSNAFNFFENNWDTTLEVSRHPDRPELYAFQKYGILYVGVHLINTDISNSLMNDNIDWFSQHVEEHNDILRGVIVFGHAQRSSNTFPFFERLREVFVGVDPTRYNIPIAYLHGDGHDWEVDTRLSGDLNWFNFNKIQVDQGAFADILIVEVAAMDTNGRTVWLQQENENQYVFGDGLFRINRQRGRYSDEYIEQLKSRR